MSKELKTPGYTVTLALRSNMRVTSTRTIQTEFCPQWADRIMVVEDLDGVTHMFPAENVIHVKIWEDEEKSS